MNMNNANTQPDSGDHLPGITLPRPAQEWAVDHLEQNWQALPQRLRGRGDFLRKRGRIKDAELMYDAATEIEGLRKLVNSRARKA